MKSSTLKTKSFKFKQFTVEGGHSGMPVSTDGVLLGSWAFQYQPKHILDIGTGTGLLALMCAQRFPQTKIDAIDIDEYAYIAAERNIHQSPWLGRITVRKDDILSCQFAQCFDAIICNPPYFNSGEHSQHEQRATARHTKSLDHQGLVSAIDQWLAPQGRASLVLPLTEGEQFIKLALTQGLHLSRVCRVKPAPHKPVHRLLFELQRETINTEETELIIQNEMGYTESFTTLTQDFYLKM